MLRDEVSYATDSRHYALYIDGDIAKLPGGRGGIGHGDQENQSGFLTHSLSLSKVVARALRCSAS